MSSSTERFLQARNFLLKNRENYEKAYREFRWPELEAFNWALDWFDVFARAHSAFDALRIIQLDGQEIRVPFGDLSRRSSQVATFLKRKGVERGDRILVSLPNILPLWEVLLGAMKLGAVIVPTSVLASSSDLSDRIFRAGVRMVVTDSTGAQKFDEISGGFIRVLVGEAQSGWIPYYETDSHSFHFVPDGVTRPEDPLLFYFTSGTTSKPKLVVHTHRSYPVGHLSTMYWIGIEEGGVHQNISSPGWAKHAWSSFFAPWNAGATLFVHDYSRFHALKMIELLRKHSVQTLCAPPTVWRMTVLEELGARPDSLVGLVSAGEPLNQEVIERVQEAWGLVIRDGYGQTETTAQIGNPPGKHVKYGSMGRPLPGYGVALLNSQNQECSEGEISLKLTPGPAGLMRGYWDDPDLTQKAMANDFYRTGDEAMRDEDGYFHFIGRGDDVFKSSDYRISPFELESVLIEHEAVAEAAIVPTPDSIRLCVPKAFVALRPGVLGNPSLALEIFHFANSRLAPYQKIRKIEFSELPKTISGKIRRNELRALERNRQGKVGPFENEFVLEDVLPKNSS